MASRSPALGSVPWTAGEGGSSRAVGSPSAEGDLPGCEGACLMEMRRRRHSPASACGAGGPTAVGELSATPFGVSQLPLKALQDWGLPAGSARLPGGWEEHPGASAAF